MGKKEKEPKEPKEAAESKPTKEKKEKKAKAPLPEKAGAQKKKVKKPKKFQLHGKDIVVLGDLPPNLNRGYLYKEGGRHKNWKKRFCAIYDNHIFYFQSEKGKLKGMINLTSRSTQVEPIKRKPNCFRLYHPTERVYYFYALSQDELNHWMRYINDEIKRVRDPTSVNKPTTLSASTAPKKDDEEDVFAAISRVEAERKESDSPPPQTEESIRANEDRKKRELAVSKLREQMQTKEKELLMNPDASSDDVSYPEGLLSPRSVNELRDEVRREVLEQQGLPLAAPLAETGDSDSSDEELRPISSGASKEGLQERESPMAVSHEASQEASKEPSSNKDMSDGEARELSDE